jgi:hypothetical protein
VQASPAESVRVKHLVVVLDKELDKREVTGCGGKVDGIARLVVAIERGDAGTDEFHKTPDSAIVGSNGDESGIRGSTPSGRAEAPIDAPRWARIAGPR